MPSRLKKTIAKMLVTSITSITSITDESEKHNPHSDRRLSTFVYMPPIPELHPYLCKLG